MSRANIPPGMRFYDRMDLIWYPVVLAAILVPMIWLRKRLDLLEALLLASGISLGGWAAVALARFAVVLPASIARVVLAVTLCGCVFGAVIVIWKAREPRSDPDRRIVTLQRPLLIAVTGVAVMTVGLEATLPHYGIAMLYWDWWEHFDLANFYRLPSGFFRSYGDGSTITSRTPLFNLLGSVALATIGDRFSIFQVVSAALGWLWALPAALLARRLMAGRAPALIAALALSPMILFCMTYSWPKALAVFSALFALERFLRLRDSTLKSPTIAWQFGLASGLTVLAHAGYVGYLLPLYAMLLRDLWLRRRSLSEIVVALLMAGFTVLPWYAWGVSEFGWRAGLFGYPQPGSATIGLWFVDHLTILATSLLPASLFLYISLGLIPDLFIMYVGSAGGLLGNAFLVRYLAIALRRRRVRGSFLTAEGTILAFAFSGLLVATVLINGWGNGWAAAEAAFIPALVVFALVAVQQAPMRPLFVRIALTECLVATGLALCYMWSPASAREPNAALAAAMHVRFLGRDTWPVGCLLLLTGAGAMVRLIVQASPWRQQAALAAHTTEIGTRRLGTSWSPMTGVDLP